MFGEIMKKAFLTIIVLSLLSLTACKQKQENTNEKLQKMPAGVHAVKVLDRIDASNYSYLQVSENGNDYWIAAPQIKVDKGETVYFSQSMEMTNFHSKSLNRTFDKILFVQNVSKTPPSASGMEQQNVKSAHSGASSDTREDVSVKPLKNGETVAQVYKDRKELAGKIVKIKGKVTKYNPNIMGRNWIHIQDGTGGKKNFDLLVTSNQSAKVGETVVVEGRVVVDKDFGAGYSYSVLLEDGKISQE